MHTTYSEKVASCNTGDKIASRSTYEVGASRYSFVKVASCTPSGELHLSPSTLAELILEHLGEEEVCTGGSGSSANYDTDDHEDLGMILLFLVEAEHECILL